MTREILNKLAKAKKINLDCYDSIIGFINPNYTKVFITLALAEVVGGRKFYTWQRDITLSVNALIKRGELEFEYTTQGWEYISEIH